MAPECRTLYVDESQSTLVSGPFGVVIWRGAPTPAAILRVREMGVAALRNSPGGAVLFGVIEADAPMPDAGARRRSAELNDELANLGVLGFGAVLGAEGFSGAVVRSVVTGLAQLARKRYAFRAFASIPGVCEWGAALLKQPDLNWRQHATQLERVRLEHLTRFGSPLSGVQARRSFLTRSKKTG